MAAPLRRLTKESGAGTVTVGFGADGGDPFSLFLRPDEKSDTGFLKLFVSAKYVDMKWITQEAITSTGLKHTHGRQGGKRRPPVVPNDFWDSFLAAITVSAD